MSTGDRADKGDNRDRNRDRPVRVEHAAKDASGIRAEPALESELRLKLEPEPEPEPKPEPEPEPDREPKLRAEPELEVELEAEAWAGAGPRLNSRPTWEPGSRPQLGPQRRTRAAGRPTDPALPALPRAVSRKVGLFADVQLVAAYARLNLQAAMEYRASFISQIFGMFLNDGIWLAFWSLYFTKFPVLGSWQREDVVVLWAVLATSFGVATGLFGNALGLSGIILRGDLDYYLVLPRDVLLHALVSRMSTSAWGDLAFGTLVFVVFGGVTPGRLALYVLSVLTVAVFFASFFVLVNSLAFFIGSSQGLSDQLSAALIHFASYPTTVFQGISRVILFTLIPAGFISSVPVHVLRRFHSGFFAALVGATLFLAIAARTVFSRGLRRYESGNLITVRL
ncbi:MAG: ABC transporter permease [Bacillota bacterium]